MSYRLCYCGRMAKRDKRSVSLPAELGQAIERAAIRDGTTFSGWLAGTAAHRLRLDAGRGALAEWEQEQGPLTPEEIVDGLAKARSLLGRSTAERSARRTA